MGDEDIIRVVDPKIAAVIRSVAQLLDARGRFRLRLVLCEAPVFVGVVGALHFVERELRPDADHVVVIVVEDRAELRLRLVVAAVRHHQQQSHDQQRQADDGRQQRRHKFTAQRFHEIRLPFLWYGIPYVRIFAKKRKFLP